MIFIPQEILDIENILKEVIKSKEDNVVKQNYEGAQGLIEAKQVELETQLDEFRKSSLNKSDRRTVTSEDVSSVVSTMTGIPSKNISEK